ncbi:hypothetical protein N619_16600 [Ectopseudomonas oleovorans]|nr:hypothetical protein N619_16600 [Pseudomonas oleovorans]
MFIEAGIRTARPARDTAHHHAERANAWCQVITRGIQPQAASIDFQCGIFAKIVVMAVRSQRGDQIA